jgi:hypothetical protein
MAESKAESLRSSIQSEKAEQLRENISVVDTTQYSPAVMQNRALIMYATEELDSLFDVEKEHIPYIAYLVSALLIQVKGQAGAKRIRASSEQAACITARTGGKPARINAAT